MGSTAAAEADRRLEALEVKLSFLEDTVDRLDEVVQRQQARIDRLLAEVQRLAQQAAAAEPTTFRSLRDELPPHY